MAKTKLLIFKAFYGSKLKFSKHILLIKIGIKCTMEENVPVQNQSLSVLLLCPKIILHRICEKSEPDIFAPVGGWKKAFRAEQSSHTCHHFHNSEKNPEHQPVRNILKQCLYIVYFHSISLFMLYRLFRKYSSENFSITPLHSLC